MKKLLSLLTIAVIWFSTVFAAYQPSTALENGVNSAWNALISIIDTEYNSEYQILIDLLMTYQARFDGDERRTWILDTLLTQVKEKSIQMDVVVTNENISNDDMMWKAVTFDITWENYAYSQDKIIVNKGDTVTINFSSTAGFHDWVVDAFDAATAKVNPGTATKVTFVADEVGTFEFYCSVGNHRAQGMIGSLVVEDEWMMNDQNMMKTDMLENANTLEHVAIGETIRWISFDGSETGKAMTKTLVMESLPEQYRTNVYAEFMNLPDAWSENFYEGWAVRKEPFDFVSTGELMMKDGVYVNDWTSNNDYSEYTHYVLTLEPRDNDPAPAEHIFEWDM